MIFVNWAFSENVSLLLLLLLFYTPGSIGPAVKNKEKD